MLRRLIVRDLRLTGRTLLFNLAVLTAFLVYAALEVGSPRAYALFTSVMLFFLPIAVFTQEDRAKAAPSTCVLPVSRQEVVTARVLLSWLLMAAGLALALGVGTVLPGSVVGGGTLLAADHLFVALAALTLASALLLSLTIRYGFLGIVIFLVAAQGLGLAAMLLAMSGSGGASRRPLRAAAEWISGRVAEAFQSTGAPRFYAVLSVLLLATCYVSYRAAVALFQRREL